MASATGMAPGGWCRRSPDVPTPRHQAIERPSDPGKVNQLRKICEALPGVTEKVSHGEAAWFVAGRQFVNTSDHHHDDRFAIWCAAPEGAQQLLTQAAPERFFRPPYVGHRGWLGVYLDIEVDWTEVASIVERAYRQVATARLIAVLDAAYRPD